MGQGRQQEWVNSRLQPSTYLFNSNEPFCTYQVI
jgi:hypothetical protein